MFAILVCALACAHMRLCFGGLTNLTLPRDTDHVVWATDSGKHSIMSQIARKLGGGGSGMGRGTRREGADQEEGSCQEPSCRCHCRATLPDAGGAGLSGTKGPSGRQHLALYWGQFSLQYHANYL